jgi:diguanylate cyclase
MSDSPVPEPASGWALPGSLVARLVTDPVLAGIWGGTAVVVGWLVLGSGPQAARFAAYGVAICALDATFAILAWRVSRSDASQPVNRRLWRTMPWAGCLFVIGDGLQTVLGLAHGDPVYPFRQGWTDLPVIAGVAALLVMLLVHRRPAASRGNRIGYWLDVGTVMAGATVLVWCLTISPVLASSEPGVLTSALTFAVVEMMVVFAIVRMVLSGTAPGTWLAMTAAFLSTVLYMLSGATGPAALSSRYFWHWLALRVLSTAFIACAPRVHEIHVRDDPVVLDPRRRRSFSILPYLTIAVTLALLTVVLPDDTGPDVLGAVIGIMILSVLVVTWQILAFTDNARLVGQLDRSLAEERRLHERLRYEASHDSLTRLANRTQLVERTTTHPPDAAATPDAAAPPDAAPPDAAAPPEVAVLLIDLDGFKEINDTYGHHVGDGVLIAVADRLRSCVRRGDTPARLGGDEFAVLLPGASAEDARRVAQRFLAEMERPIEVEGHPVLARASVGMAVGRGEDLAGLLRVADSLMYQAKAGRRGRAADDRRPAGTSP